MIYCHNCFISKSSQWRTSPYGRKTLCNSCGISYNQKKLFYNPNLNSFYKVKLHIDLDETEAALCLLNIYYRQIKY